MMKYLVRLFIPQWEQVKDPQVRKAYGVLGGMMGIVTNGLLFLVKLIVGILMQSIAVISDAFNNLSDMAASIISLAGASLGGRRADAEHPYGHGRAEYISALLVSVLIMIFGFELFKSSVGNVVDYSLVVLSPVAVVLLGFSVLLKLWLWRSNRYLAAATDSAPLRAASKDSLNDAIATSVILLASLISPYWYFPLDGVLGILLSCMIMLTGLKMAKEVIDKLLGSQPADELCACIEAMVLEGEGILGMHGLMIHDYGPGRTIASAHAEVREDLSLVQVHDVIDRIEKQIMEELGVDIVIHMDPVSPKDR